MVGLAAVFAGCTVTMTVLALAESLFLLIAAIPFGIATYLLWYQASGRMRERMRARAARGPRDARGDATTGTQGGRSRFAEEARRARGEGRARGENGARADGRTREPGPADDGMRPREAYDTLGLDPDASQDAIRSAYRERVKETHPDSGGDEETFKRVTEAYETLSE